MNSNVFAPLGAILTISSASFCSDTRRFCTDETSPWVTASRRAAWISSFAFSLASKNFEKSVTADTNFLILHLWFSKLIWRTKWNNLIMDINRDKKIIWDNPNIIICHILEDGLYNRHHYTNGETIGINYFIPFKKLLAVIEPITTFFVYIMYHFWSYITNFYSNYIF